MAEVEKQVRSINILYGTETGNAEDVADRISRELERRHMQITLMSLNEFDIVTGKVITHFLFFFLRKSYLQQHT